MSVETPVTTAGLGLFEDTPADCTCGQTGYCPAHGDYTPAVQDPDVLAAIAESARRRKARRVIRKELPH